MQKHLILRLSFTLKIFRFRLVYEIKAYLANKKHLQDYNLQKETFFFI
jgi:hypothetical protein